MFRSISINFTNFEILDLKSISPALFNFHESEIEMPGIQSGINGKETSLKICDSLKEEISNLEWDLHEEYYELEIDDS